MSDTTNPHGEPSQESTPSMGIVDPAAVKRGHETDTYDNKSVLSVPLLVILFFVLAFGTVTIVFGIVSKSEEDPNANPQAVAENSPPLNERLDRLHRNSGGPKDQPRLEPLVERTGEARAITRSPTDSGNSPELHPEDIRVNRKNTPELYTSGSIESDKTVSRISIDDAMRIALQKNEFPVQKNAGKPPESAHAPTAANGGRAAPPKLPDPAEGGKK